MKKSFLAMTLALALCIGLTVPAFAANDTPVYKVSVDDAATYADKTFALRHITQETSMEDGIFNIKYIFTRDVETDDYHNENIPVLTSRNAITVSGLRTGADPSDWVNLYAWSDPDSDGIYDEHLFVISNGATTTTLEKGPFTYQNGDGSGRMYSTSILLYESNTLDSNKDTPDSTIELSADFLTKLFGPNTFIEVEIFTRGENTEGGYYGAFGEQYYHFYVPGDAAPTTTPSSSATPKFTDVAAGAYYAEPVQWAIENNITAGTSDTTFSPDQTCTTAQILTFLWRANGQPEPTIQNPFSDVSSGDYYYKAALWAFEMGLVDGKAFNGDTPCTRSATMTYFWKLSGKPKTGSNIFTDVPNNADYAQAVAWAVTQNITSGTGNNAFSPDATCTRAQIVSFLYRYYVK